MLNNSDREQGVTLVELLVSIVILSIVIISFMAFFTNSFNNNARASEKLQTTNLVREIQEELKVNSMYQDLVSFIASVKSGYPNLQKSSYPNLDLVKDIDVMSDTGIYKLTLKRNNYDVKVLISPEADSSSLYKFNVQVLKDNKLLAQTFTYIEF